MQLNYSAQEEVTRKRLRIKPEVVAVQHVRSATDNTCFLEARHINPIKGKFNMKCFTKYLIYQNSGLFMYIFVQWISIAFSVKNNGYIVHLHSCHIRCDIFMHFRSWCVRPVPISKRGFCCGVQRRNDRLCWISS